MFNDAYRYDSVPAAYFIAAWANQNKISANLTKIQKLLYIAYGANLVIGNERLCNEHPQAWPYGPVFPVARGKLSKVGIGGITMGDRLLDGLRGDTYMGQLIAFVFGGFGGKTSGQLAAWSRGAGSPWERIAKAPTFKWGAEIPDMYIYEYFSKLINISLPNGQ